MIGFFLLLVLLMVLIAVCVPMLSGGGRRVTYVRRDVVPDDVVEVVDDGPYDTVYDDGPRPLARRRRVVRRTRRVY